MQTLKTPVCLTHAFLTAPLNRTVSTPAEDAFSMQGTKEMLGSK
jgi:hypothetical protein